MPNLSFQMYYQSSIGYLKTISGESVEVDGRPNTFAFIERKEITLRQPANPSGIIDFQLCQL